MGGCYSSKPIVINAETERQRIRSFSLSSSSLKPLSDRLIEASVNFRERSSSRISTPARVYGERARIRLASVDKKEINADEEAEMMENFLKKIRKQTILTLIGMTLFWIGSICFYPSMNITNENAENFGSILFVIGTIPFVVIGWENISDSDSRKDSTENLQPQQISGYCAAVATILLILGMALWAYDWNSGVLLTFTSTTMFCFVNFIDMLIFFYEKKTVGFNDFPVFDKVLCFIEFQPYLLSEIGNILCTFGTAYLLPSFYRNPFYYLLSINLFVWGSFLFVIASVVGVFLVFGQFYIEKIRASFAEREQDSENLIDTQQENYDGIEGG